ncbi:hypothetical protein BDV96DRAFT_319071 [Lophiotrema nucula]|uniref:Apple domain-containing protein n=1 Tax=Lophiotrema nucula TaxID=690887 RepID=A0A6A5ZLT9_9PLEO|nr:hypothetical protein BDV96DRAFT_319071 [Lophiotrema nucula]
MQAAGPKPRVLHHCPSTLFCATKSILPAMYTAQLLAMLGVASSVSGWTLNFKTTRPQASEPVRRADTANATSCRPVETLGQGPVPSPDTAAEFLTSSLISGPALNASTPSGYNVNFKNLHASSSDSTGYLGTIELDSYNVSACAALCSSQEGCLAFNIFFERDPAAHLTPDCANPNSTTAIKCVKWAKEVVRYNATNNGFKSQQFEVKIGGSNGYTNLIVFTNKTLGESIIANAKADGNIVSTPAYSASLMLLAIALVFAGFL